jgi:hypothetical protein
MCLEKCRKHSEICPNYCIGDKCRPCNRIASECYQISLWKWSLGSDRILYKKAGHKRETICPQIKWGSTFGVGLNELERATVLNVKPPVRTCLAMACVCGECHSELSGASAYRRSRQPFWLSPLHTAGDRTPGSSNCNGRPLWPPYIRSPAREPVRPRSCVYL